jgi:hypothetical protein
LRKAGPRQGASLWHFYQKSLELLLIISILHASHGASAGRQSASFLPMVRLVYWICCVICCVSSLRANQQHQRCKWVSPNAENKPWTSGGPGNKALDQLKSLANRAHIDHATWKMFRHSLNTHGKQWFGQSKEQMRVQLRHEDEETQKHYDHADLANLRSAVKENEPLRKRL